MRRFEGAIALGVLLRPVTTAESAAIVRKIEAFRDRRHESQPREPSAGCVFKNRPARRRGS